LNDGDVIYTSSLGTSNLNVRADTTSNVGSVVFTLNGIHYITETSWPFAIGGNDDNNDYLAWSYTPGAVNIIQATPFAGADGKGKAGAPLEIKLTITVKPK
jgi:hypothetical protein